jgi:hypothetical protein
MQEGARRSYGESVLPGFVEEATLFCKAESSQEAVICLQRGAYAVLHTAASLQREVTLGREHAASIQKDKHVGLFLYLLKLAGARDQAVSEMKKKLCDGVPMEGEIGRP